MDNSWGVALFFLVFLAGAWGSLYWGSLIGENAVARAVCGEADFVVVDHVPACFDPVSNSFEKVIW